MFASVHRLFIILIVVVTCCLNVFPVEAQGYLRTHGHDIVDEKGNKIILRGMGLGGWMLQEGYMFQLGFLGQQYRIKEKIIASVGKEKADQFYERWLLEHTTKRDIDLLAAMGFNSIRLPMHYALYTLPVEQEPVAGKNTWLEKGFALTDSLLNWCKANKLYLILDLHAAPGGQGNDLAISDRDPAKPSLWDSEANLQKTIDLWKKIAERYADEPWIGGYDIINEPNWGFEDPEDKRGTAEKKNAPLKKLLEDITKAIREVDKKHIIIIEGNGFGNNYNGIFPPWDDNMVVSFHKYGNFNTKEAIGNFLAIREKYNLPLWLGESGENFNTWFTEAIQLVEENNIGWAWWQHKKMGINNPLEIKKPAGYDELLADWSGKGEKLSSERAWKVLTDLLDNTRAENNIYHKGVADAMFRQVSSTVTLPYNDNKLADKLTIKAVDYDMGRQGFAYYDKDTASYHYTPGVNTTGNKGRAYRNDGVDIRKGENGYYVFSTEDGEWLQYTIDVTKAGNYAFSFTTTATKQGGVLGLSIDKKERKEIAVPATQVGVWSKVTIKDVALETGLQSIQVRIKMGGFELLEFNIEKAK